MKAKPSSTLVSDVIQLMEQWAPAWTAETWDRVGLFTGDPAAPAQLVWVALELSPKLLDQALEASVNMLLLHHPPFLKPLGDIRNDRPATSRLLRAAAAELALFAAHTNLDVAPGGVNDALAQRLGLVETSPLLPAGGEGLAKLVTFVPPEYAEQVAQALFATGAGRIGDYLECSFLSQGTGTFRAPKDGHPFLGQPGQRQWAQEMRLEVIIPLESVPAAMAILRQAHPYEEPAADVYPLRQAPSGCGLGRVGRLPAPEKGPAFLARAARALGALAPLAAGALPPVVERVAVVGGSGADLLPVAAARGAQVLITGEARHHVGQEAADLGICLLTLGHYQTEKVVVEPWARRLAAMLSQAGRPCDVQPWTEPADPWRLVQVD